MAEGQHQWLTMVPAPPDEDIEMVRLTGMTMLDPEYIEANAWVECRACGVSEDDPLAKVQCMGSPR